MLGKTVGCGLCRGCLKVIKVAVFFLIIGKSVAHMRKHLLGKFLRFLMGHVGSEPICVKSDLVHADKSDC